MPRLLLLIVTLLFAGTLRAEPAFVACVGDSITFGSKVNDREKNAYPFVLAKLLGPAYVTGNFGVSGATLMKKANKPYWEQPAYPAALHSNPAVVVIMLGTNDTKTVNFPLHTAYGPDLTALVDSFAQLPSKPKIWLCLPPVINPNAYTILETNLEYYCETIRAVAAQRHLGVIDVHAVFVGHPELLVDGVHPNVQGALLLAQTVAAAIKGK